MVNQGQSLGGEGTGSDSDSLDALGSVAEGKGAGKGLSSAILADS
jgi:hypothetical protein